MLCLGGDALSCISKAVVFGMPVHTSFPHMWKFQTQVTQGQVTRSRQVTSPQKSLNARQSYTEWPIALKLPAIDILVPVSIKCISRNFDICGPRSGHFCDIFIISQWKKDERRLFWKKTIRNTLKHRVTGRLDNLSRNIATNELMTPRHVAKVISGNDRSPAVFRQYFYIETS